MDGFDYRFGIFKDKKSDKNHLVVFCDRFYFDYKIFNMSSKKELKTGNDEFTNLAFVCSFIMLIIFLVAIQVLIWQISKPNYNLDPYIVYYTRDELKEDLL